MKTALLALVVGLTVSGKNPTASITFKATIIPVASLSVTKTEIEPGLYVIESVSHGTFPGDNQRERWLVYDRTMAAPVMITMGVGDLLLRAPPSVMVASWPEGWTQEEMTAELRR